MFYITQLIYIKKGQEALFDEFEKVAIPIIRKYGGQILLRIRPGDDAFVESHTEKPYEVHLVEFKTETDFENFLTDEDRKQFLHLKEQSISSTVLIKGVKL